MSDTALMPMQEQPQTVQLTAVPPWAIELSKAMRDVSDKVIELTQSVSSFEGRVSRLEMDKEKHSGGIRQLSSSNAEQDSQLAQERAAREELAKKVDIQTVMLGEITSLLATPLAKKIGVAAGLLLLGLLTSATGYLARGNVQTSQPTIIQLAPVAGADAGAHQ